MRRYFVITIIAAALLIIWACSDLEHSNPFDSNSSSITPLNSVELQIEKIDRIKVIWDSDYFNKEGYVFRVDRKIGTTGTWQEKFKVFEKETYYFTDSIAVANQTNYYRVSVAFDEKISVPVEASVFCSFNAPSGIYLNRKDIKTIQINWTDNSNGEDGFKIDRFSAGTWTAGHKILGPNSTTWTDSSAVLNDSIQYRIYGYRKSMVSEFAVTPLIDNTLPQPTGLSLKQNDVSTFELNWTDNCNGEEGYLVERKIDEGQYVQIAVLNPNTIKYVDSSVSKGLSNVSYRVLTYYKTYKSIPAEATQQIVFPAPGDLSYEKLTLSSIEFTWTDNSLSEDGFKIDKKVDDNAWVVNYSTVAQNSTTWTDSNADINKNIQYRIYGYKGINTTSQITSPVIDNTIPAPSNLSYVKLSISSIKIDWIDNSAGEDGFKIDRAVNGTWATVFASVGSNVKTYTDSSAPINQTVQYRVYTYKSTNVSSSISTTSIDNTFPAPSNPSLAQLSVNSVKLTWTDNSLGEDGFKIDRKNTTGTWVVNFGSVGSNIVEWTDTSATISDSLQYRIYAYKGTNYSTYVFSSAADLTFPPPTGVTFSILNINSIKLNWVDNSTGETGFKIDRSVDGGAWVVAYGSAASNAITWTDSNAPVNKNIQYRIYGYTATDASSYATSSVIANTFPVPVLNTVTQQTVSSFKLDWSDNSTGEDGFKIERKIDTEAYVQIASVGANVITYTDSSINKKGYTTVYYRIRAFKGTDYSAYSEKTQTISFPAPSNVNYTKTSVSSINVTWSDNSTGEDGFKIDKKVGSLEWVIAYATAAPNAITWTDTNAEPNTIIQYRIYGYKGLNASSEAYSVSIDNTFPQPSGITYSKLSISSVKINWLDNSAGETGFIIDRKVGVQSWAAYDTTAANAVTWTDNNAIINSNLQYRVKAYKNSYYSNYVESSQIDNTFPPPTNLTLTQAKSKAISIKLDWTDNSVGEDGFKISRKDEVGNWSDIYTVTSNTVTWTDANITVYDSLGYRVKGYKGSFYSTNAFADINTLSTLSVTSPNGGETLVMGTTHNITWSDNLTENVKIDLYKGSTLNTTIASSTASDGSHSWTIPTTLTVGTDYRIRISSTSNSSLYDESNANFTINPVPNLTVLSPNGGESWTMGTSQSITWTDNIAENVKIDLYKNGVFNSTIISSTASTGTYTWAIPTTLSAASDYKIRITGVTTTTLYDESNADFTLNLAPNVTVTSPNGGESWTMGTSQSITWTDNIAENVKIDLYKSGVFTSTIISSTASTGTYSWAIPTTLSAASDYKIRITGVTTTTLYDESNTNFTLIPVPSITVTSPNGGEIVSFDSTVPITWNDTILGKVKLDFYQNDVIKYTIVDSVASTGSYNWYVRHQTPTATSLYTNDDYKIRITSVSDPTLYDESNNSFIINPTISTPSGGESWALGSTISIVWKAMSSSTFILELYKGSVLHSTISSSATTPYYWTIPLTLPQGTDYKIKVVSTSNSSLYDESDLSFSILDEPLPQNIILVPSGTFSMGNGALGDSAPIHSVTISKEFYLSKYEVTQKEWTDIMGSNPVSGYGVGDNYPVNRVSWYGILRYCNLRSISEGFAPCYTINGSTDPAVWGAVPTSSDVTWDAVVCDFNANGYRLPSEAEWEYTSRYNDGRKYPWGSSEPTVFLCNFNDWSYNVSVGSYPRSNSNLGICDMAGNVAEWVWDWYGSYTSTSLTDPTGPISGTKRIIRGGSYTDSGSLECYYRTNISPYSGAAYYGFRVARTK